MARLEEIMSREVATADAETPVTAAAQQMVKGRFGSIVVLKAGWIEGIFTERDALRAAASGNDLSAEPVSAWMTTEPMTAPPDMDSDEAAAIMAANGFRHLPVVEGKNLLGIVSLRDVLAARIGRAKG